MLIKQKISFKTYVKQLLWSRDIHHVSLNGISQTWEHIEITISIFMFNYRLWKQCAPENSSITFSGVCKVWSCEDSVDSMQNVNT